jgi:hypothetical protein
MCHSLLITALEILTYCARFRIHSGNRSPPIYWSIRQFCGSLGLQFATAINGCQKTSASLVPVSQNIPSGDLEMVARSGHLEFHRDAEKSQMDEVFSLMTSCNSTLGSREAAKARSDGKPRPVCDSCQGIQSTFSVGSNHSLPIESTSRIVDGPGRQVLTNDLPRIVLRVLSFSRQTNRFNSSGVQGSERGIWNGRTLSMHEGRTIVVGHE